MQAILVGPDDEGIGAALEAHDVTVTAVEGVATTSSLEDAGLADADLLVVTDAEEATAIPVARELNPDVRIVAYTEDSLPEFVSAQEVLAMDPRLLGPEAVAEELTA